MRKASRLVLTPGNEVGNRSGSAGQSNQSGLTAIFAKGRPRGRSGSKLSYSSPGPVCAVSSNSSRLARPQRLRNSDLTSGSVICPGAQA